MSTDQPSWMTAEAIHLPESTSEMFIYQPLLMTLTRCGRP
jgi:hypothetical protein